MTNKPAQKRRVSHCYWLEARVPSISGRGHVISAFVCHCETTSNELGMLRQQFTGATIATLSNWKYSIWQRALSEQSSPSGFTFLTREAEMLKSPLAKIVFQWQEKWKINMETSTFYLGKDSCSKSDEFSKKFQMAFDPPFIFRI